MWTVSCDDMTLRDKINPLVDQHSEKSWEGLEYGFIRIGGECTAPTEPIGLQEGK